MLCAVSKECVSPQLCCQVGWLVLRLAKCDLESRPGVPVDPAVEHPVCVCVCVCVPAQSKSAFPPNHESRGEKIEEPEDAGGDECSAKECLNE